MPYTRPWTPLEERRLRAAPHSQLRYLARQLHRSPGAVLERWKRWNRNATRQRKHHEGVHGLLPAHVTAHDPSGIVCLTCGQPRAFRTFDGRCFQECRCGCTFVPRRKP